jgi:hypothetical protein
MYNTSSIKENRWPQSSFKYNSIDSRQGHLEK